MDQSRNQRDGYALVPYRWPILRTAIVASGVAIALLALTMLVVTALSFGWTGVALWDAPLGEERTSGLLRGAIGLVGVLVGSGAAVIAYRNQHLKELAHAADRERRLQERFVAAAGQIGDVSPAVRIAGLYAMAQLAASWPDARATQQCVDVICGYLRMPVPAKRGVKNPKDLEVRRTALRIIADYTTKTRLDGWGLVNIDLTGATLGRLSFLACAFGGFAARGATLTDELAFHECEIAGELDLREARANARVVLSKTSVVGRAYLDGIEAHSSVMVTESRIGSHFWMNHAIVLGLFALDSSVIVGQAGFQGTSFRGKARFDRTQFARRVDFGGAEFLAQSKFSKTTCEEGVSFQETAFTRASFIGAKLGRVSWTKSTRRGVSWTGPTAAELAPREPRRRPK